MSDWIDFKALRKGLSFEKVLDSYGIEIKRKHGNRHVGFCPLPGHQGRKRSPSFSAKLDVGCWQCFGCKASGNVLDFAVYMDGGDPEDPKALRATALKLRDQFGISCGEPPASAKAAQPSGKPAIKPQASAPPSSPKRTLVNPPLDFELKDLNPDHPYLKERGFHPDTIRHFNLGYCSRGLMKGRVAIPLHDGDGRLVGYAGRITDDAAVNEQTPKYLLPGAREREGAVIEFRKSMFLYNGFRIREPADDVIVVEGFPSVWWLWQWGYRSVVGLMGSDCSDEQARLIVCCTKAVGRVWVFADADGPGQSCCAGVLMQVAAHRCCRRVPIIKGQPTDCTPADLARLLWQV